MKKTLLILIVLAAVTVNVQAQDVTPTSTGNNDFGSIVSLGVEKKLARGLSLNVEADHHTQRDAERTSRWMLGTSLSYRFFQTADKRFNLKTQVGFDYIWRQHLTETYEHYNSSNVMNGYNTDASYWRKRQRYSLGVSGTYSPSKRWSFSLKETLQYNHYCSATTERTKWRYNDDDDLYSVTDNKVKAAKDRLLLRNRLSAKYNIKGVPLNPFAAIDYGVGLNYNTSKWKLTGGLELKVQKQHQFEVFYRFVHENDDDEPNGHLVGWGYKYSF